MAVPTHQAGCDTRLWATQCPDCSENIFFFMCSCGSKVFFDVAGPPWTEHADRCIPYLARLLRQAGGLRPRDVWLRIREFAAEQGLPIPPGIEAAVLGQETTGPPRITPLRITPKDGASHTAVGQVMSVDQVNFFRRFSVLDNAFGRMLLGSLLDQKFVEVVIREDPNPQTGYSHEYRFYLPQAAFQRSQVGVRASATARLRVHVILNLPRIWITDAIRPAP